MLKFAISASFILGSTSTFSSQAKAEEFAFNGPSKASFFLLNRDAGSQKRFYYLIKDKDMYSATKLRLIDLKGLEINRFEHFKNTLLQSPKSEK